MTLTHWLQCPRCLRLYVGHYNLRFFWQASWDTPKEQVQGVCDVCKLERKKGRTK